MRETISPQHGKIQVCESFKAEVFDAGAILIRTDHPDYDLMMTFKINNVAFNPNKVSEYGDPTALVNMTQSISAIAKHKPKQ